MKKSAYIFALAALVSCSALDTSPEDYYASGNYWQTTAQVEAYLPGIYSRVRDVVFNHTIRFGELGSGIYREPVSVNGNNVADQPIIIHNLSADVPGVDSWGDYYSAIADCNLFIEKAGAADFLPEDERDYLLAQAYGLRAMLYFDLYRIWGGVPLRLEADVAGQGRSDVRELYLARSSASATMTQILADAEKSLELFGSQDGFDPYGLGSKIYWNKAAGQCLLAEILLWNTKVSVGDYAAVSDGSLLPRAKQLLEAVASRSDLALESVFSKIFDDSNKAGDEVIFAVHYGIGEATNALGSYLYHTSTGEIHNMQARGGEAFGDPLSLGSGHNQTYEYLPQMYLQYEGANTDAAYDTPLDTRADATFKGVFKDGKLEGTVCCKNVGSLSSGLRVMSGDFVLYRLAWVYLTLAEIANWQDDAAGFELYVNKTRERAYAGAWNDARKVTDAGFKANELAILAEKDREFIQEGQRWWDLRRMQAVRGDESSHLLLLSEGNPLQDGSPVLGEAWRALWPLSTSIIAGDPLLADDQNQGY